MFSPVERRAWNEDRFGGQYVTVEAPDRNEDGSLADTTHTVARDEGLRETTLEKLASLKPVARENGVHTAGNSSQISDGASAVLLMTEEKAAALGLTPRARVVDTCNVGVDPVLMLTGPIDATKHLLARNEGRGVAGGALDQAACRTPTQQVGVLLAVGLTPEHPPPQDHQGRCI